jgi:hypothetical protein
LEVIARSSSISLVRFDRSWSRLPRICSAFGFFGSILASSTPKLFFLASRIAAPFCKSGSNKLEDTLSAAMTPITTPTAFSFSVALPARST